MAREDGLAGSDQAAGCQTAYKRNRALLGSYRRKRTWRVPVARKVRHVHPETQFGEASGDIVHNELVGRNPMEQPAEAYVRARPRIGQPNRIHVHAAGTRVNHVAVHGIAARRVEGEKRSDDEKRYAGDCQKSRFSFKEPGRTRERLKLLAV